MSKLQKKVSIISLSAIVFFALIPSIKAQPISAVEGKEPLSKKVVKMVDLQEKSQIALSGALNLRNEILYQTEENTSEGQLVYLGEYTITAYCSCEECCGEWARNREDNKVIGAAQVELQYGVSCASSKNLAFGTSIYIEALDGKEEGYNITNSTLIVQDRVAKWIENKYCDKIIDIYFPNHELVEKFGKIKSKVYIKK